MVPFYAAIIIIGTCTQGSGKEWVGAALPYKLSSSKVEHERTEFEEEEEAAEGKE